MNKDKKNIEFLAEKVLVLIEAIKVLNGVLEIFSKRVDLLEDKTKGNDK